MPSNIKMILSTIFQKIKTRKHTKQEKRKKIKYYTKIWHASTSFELQKVACVFSRSEAAKHLEVPRLKLPYYP